MRRDLTRGKRNLKSTVFEDSPASAKKAAYKILSYRDHSTHEISQKLRAKGFSEETITETLQFLKEIQLLDDQKFASEWSRFRIERGHYGPIRLRRELLSKGLPPEEVEDVIRRLSEEYDPIPQIETALTQRYKKCSDLQDPKCRRRAFDYLRRKGYETHNILAVFRKIGVMT